MTDESLRDHIGSVLERDRSATDHTLQTERTRVDARVADVIARATGASAPDLSDSPSTPRLGPDTIQVAETLVEAAGSLAEAADGLSRAAQKLKEAGDSNVIDTLHHVASALDATVEKVGGEEAAQSTAQAAMKTDEPTPVVVDKLAEVAENLGVVAAALAEERIDVDETLREERDRLDRTVEEERETMGEVVAGELAAQRQLLEDERRETDRNLERERADTDRALDQTLDLLQEEQQAHGQVRDMMVTREEFLAIVSHDLRTPLSVIAVNAAIIAERAAVERTPGDMVRAVERIQRSADQMGRMLSDLLDATRFEHGQFRLHPSTDDIVDSVNECAAAFDDLARVHGVALHVEAPQAPVRLGFDRDRIIQVLSNLLRNALQFTPGGGLVTIRVVPQRHGCRIDVSDTGSGIATQDLERIFNRFEQGAGTSRQGLGLGLYISRAIIHAHGGRIWATSDIGKGSTLSFTLPADSCD